MSRVGGTPGAKSNAHDTSGLLHAGRRKPGKADDVARSVDARDRSAVVFVDFEFTALSRRKTGCVKIQSSGVTSPSRRDKNGFGCHTHPDCRVSVISASSQLHSATSSRSAFLFRSDAWLA